MNFTYDAYIGMLDCLREKKYECTDYHERNIKPDEKYVILRHDIDTDIEKAVRLSHIEKEQGFKSTYFVLLTSDFYNVFSKSNRERLKQILDDGNEIGLHFDEVAYDFNFCDGYDELVSKVKFEAKMLSELIEFPVSTVSMHRPSKGVLEANLDFGELTNSYKAKFFGEEYKYLSDSRRNWREPVDEIIKEMKYSRLHILTHAFWYNEKEKDISDSVRQFVNSGNAKYYNYFSANIRDMNSIMKESEVK